MKEKKKFKLAHIFKAMTIIAAMIGALVLILCVVLLSIYGATQNNNFLMGLVISLIVLFVLTIVYSIIAITYSKHFIVRGVVETTAKNYEVINNFRNNLNFYRGQSIEEFNHLNDLLLSFEQTRSSSVTFSKVTNYDDLKLEYTDNYKDMITYESLRTNYRELIIRAIAFRNAFINFKYDIFNTNLTQEEKEAFVKNAKAVFTYSNILIADNPKENEFYIFLPSFDSISRLKEDLAGMLRNISIVRSDKEGNKIISPRASAVIFPYTDIDSIFQDLSYSSRQNKLINVYIPSRFSLDSKHSLTMTYNMNFVNYILEQFLIINSSDLGSREMNSKFRNTVKLICQYLGFESFSVFDSVGGEYLQLQFEYKDNDECLTLKTISENFSKSLEKNVDDDGSYYFSSRNHASDEIGRYLDVCGYESSFVYLVRSGKKIDSILIFGKSSPSFLDSYLRESLLVFCSSIANYVSYYANVRKIENGKHRFASLLKITNNRTYSINPETYELVDFSDAFKAGGHRLKLGEICYEAIYGNSKPCNNCPLKAGKKMLSVINNEHFETSLTIDITYTKEKTLLLTPVEKEGYIIKERFDRELLVSTFYSFIERVENLFVTSQKGYIIMANIDNNKDMLSGYSSNQYSELLRTFFAELARNLDYANEIYFIPPQSFALVVPNGHRKEIFNTVERIYDYSKKLVLGERNDIKLNLSYFLQAFPSGYQNAEEFVRFLVQTTQTPKDSANKDLIFVPETKYVRKASHKDFVMDILENSLNKNTFNIKLQPILNIADRHIMSAEMLLRVSESYLGTEMNTSEIIDAAEANNKISMITNILIEQITELYRTNGESLFKKYGLKNLSLNTDYSFFKDLNFIDKVKELERKKVLPDNFLVFEIQENEIYAHVKEFAEITSAIRRNNITMVCDNYTGKLVSLENLRELGFQGIKISRSVVTQLRSGAPTDDLITNLLENANKLKLSVALVGVETKEQYDLLRNKNFTFSVQGYYFYRPLDAAELVNTLITANEK